MGCFNWIPVTWGALTGPPCYLVRASGFKVTPVGFKDISFPHGQSGLGRRTGPCIKGLDELSGGTRKNSHSVDLYYMTFVLYSLSRAAERAAERIPVSKWIHFGGQVDIKSADTNHELRSWEIRQQP